MMNNILNKIKLKDKKLTYNINNIVDNINYINKVINKLEIIKVIFFLNNKNNKVNI